MAHTELIRVTPDRPPTRWRRMGEAVRSIWLGPYNTKDKVLARLFGGSPSSSGVPVNETSALNYSAVWAAVSIISSDVASLPLIHYKREANGAKTRFTGGKLYRLLHDEPNSEMTAITFRETLQGHALTWGNGYAEIERDAMNRPAALWPITPDRVTPIRQDGRLKYRVTNPSARDVILEAANTLHIPGLGFDGEQGYSVIHQARESIGLGLATERFGATFFGNGSTFGGVISWPQGVSATDQAVKSFKEMIESRHTGVDRAHKFLQLYQGAKYDRLGIPPNDAQFLETRKFQVEEIARWFKLPPHKIGAMEHATFSNIEHQDLEYYKSCLRAWLVRWEQEINRKCIASTERNLQFVEHLVEGFLRGDLQSRYSAYAVGRQWGWLSANRICEFENLDPLPKGGDVFLVPQNMAPADRIDDVIDAQTRPPAPPAKPAAKDDPEPDPAARAVEALAVKITELTEQAEAHLVRASAAETALIDGAKAEAEHERDAAAEAMRQVLALTVLKDEAEAEAERAKLAVEQATLEAAALETERDALRVIVETPPPVDPKIAEQEAQIAALAAQVQAAQAQAEQQRQDAEAVAVHVKQEADARQRQILVAHRALFVSAYSWMIQRETDRARKAYGTPEKFRHWLTQFYPLHEEVCRTTLRPVVQAWLAATGSTADLDQTVDGLVQAHLTESQRQLRVELEDADLESLPPALERVFRRWEAERADVTADRVLKEGLA